MKNSRFFQHATDSMNRRAFLRLSGVLSLGLASASVIPSTAEAIKFNRKLYKISKTRVAMGTFVSMTLLHPSKNQAEEAMGKAFEEIDRLTRTLSRFDQTTAVAYLNREGYLKDVPPELADVVARALEYHRITNGAFDISVKPLIDLLKERLSGIGKRPPSESELRKALELIDAADIQSTGRTIRFKKPGMGITLDGIAKGYVVDRASNVLADHQINNHLINAGGDIRTSGNRRDGKPWTVAIQDPHKGGHYPDIIHMTDGAIATSGNYEVYFDRERISHHIINPGTGLSPDANTSVSVTAETAMDADALSTSVFVMNAYRGIRFIDSIPKCECLVLDKGNRKIRSAGWKNEAIKGVS